MSLNINETYTGGGAFLKASDLQRRRLNITITGARLENFKDGSKIVLDIENLEKRFVLNKTNANMIAELLEERDAEKWVGSTITLRPDKTQDQSGNTVDCIRVDYELPAQKYKSVAADVLARNPAVAQTAQQEAAFAGQPLVPQGRGEQIEEKIPF